VYIVCLVGGLKQYVTLFVFAVFALLEHFRYIGMTPVNCLFLLLNFGVQMITPITYIKPLYSNDIPTITKAKMLSRLNATSLHDKHFV
jgi:hypothetical protein